jgi:hypothetical protein
MRFGGVEKKTAKRSRRAGAVGLFAVMLLAAAIAGCSSSSSEEKAGKQESGTVQNNANAVSDKKADSLYAAAESSANAANHSQANQAAESNNQAASFSAAPAAAGGDAFSKKIMYNASLVLKTDDYETARTKVQDIVALSGGYILQFSENTTSTEKRGTFTIKVPSGGFTPLLDQLEKVAVSSERNVRGQDVSEEYVDLESRLKAKQVVEARLLSFMEKATKTDELLAFSNELAKVQEEIEKIKGRMRFIDQNVAMSTIELRLYQKADAAASLKVGEAGNFGKKVSGAFQFGIAVLSAVIQALVVFIVGALPIAVILALIGIPVWYAVRRRKRKLLDIRMQLRKQNQQALQDEQAENDI